MTTATRNETLEAALNTATPGRLADALAKVALGTMLAPRKVTFAGLTADAAQNITTAANYALATVSPAMPGGTLVLPAILSVISCRVTAGAAAAGPRAVTDSGGAAGAPGANGPGIALLSDDGKTLTFEGAVTGFVLEYVPRPASDMSADFARE